MRKIILPLAAMLTLTIASCQKHEPVPEFLDGSTISLNMGGKAIHTYNQDTWQSSFKEKAIQYRVFSDDMTNYYTLVCGQKPTEKGQQIIATLTWASGGAAANSLSDLTFSVEQIDPDTGAIWLWCKKKSIGVAVIQ